MSNAASQPLLSNEVMDLLVENEIKLEALVQVLKDTNPLVHELYLGKIENLKERKDELNRALTARLKPKCTQA